MEGWPSRRFLLALCALGFAWAAPALGQDRNFTGGWFGVSTLGGDGATAVSNEAARISLYKPENGISGGAYIGRHLSDYFSLQGSYLYNRNSLLLTSSRSSEEEFRFYEQRREAATHSWVGELMFYVRPLRSSFRPYLSAGGVLVRVTSGEGRVVEQSPQPLPAPGRYDGVSAALRVAVGVDVPLGQGWQFRFSLIETVSSNPTSEQLTPPTEGILKNFHNVFGFVKTF